MDFIIYTFIIIFGLVFGSFFCCMGYRIPNKISTYKDGSFCPNCRNKLKWYMNIPLISYIIQGGKCAYCKEKISVIYPICELLTAILFLSSYLILGINFNLYVSIVIISAFIITLVSDFKYFYVSDRVIIISIVLILGLTYIFEGFMPFLYSILNGSVMIVTMILIKLLGNFMFKRESMGSGDIKLMGLIGVATGIINSFFTIFGASLLAIIYVIFAKKLKTNEIIPFGPFLLFACLLTIYFSEYITKFIDYLLI